MIYDDQLTHDPEGWDWFDLLDLHKEVAYISFNKLETIEQDQIEFENANADL